MAKIVLGLGSSHGPQLQLPPDRWYLRASADRRNPELWFQGRTYQFPELVEERADEHLERELSPETAQARFDSCQKAIAQIAQTLAEAKPDVAVIFGDDQHEVFNDQNMPSMAVYWGGTIDDVPGAQWARNEPGVGDTSYSNAPDVRVSHPTEPRLGRHIIESLVDSGFEVAHSNALPQGKLQGGIGHAFHFVYRRLMNNQVIPHVPMLLNTFFPPNQPTIKRCYQLGQAIREAIESWDTDKGVALIASGGLSHFVIEEELDQHIIAGLQAADEQKLTDLPNRRFNSGTSEIRNWLAVAGAMAGDGLSMELVDYVPCYRTEAGTGCAMAFAEWK